MMCTVPVSRASFLTASMNELRLRENAQTAEEYPLRRKWSWNCFNRMLFDSGRESARFVSRGQ